jgi:hypothetical protein
MRRRLHRLSTSGAKSRVFSLVSVVSPPGEETMRKTFMTALALLVPVVVAARYTVGQ